MRDDPNWQEWEAMLASFYGELNYGKHAGGRLMKAGHVLLEDMIKEPSFANVLEVGSGTGEHLQFVKHGFETYCMLDRNPAMIKLSQQKYQGDKRNIQYKLGEVESLPVADESVDRLIATHVLEHVYRPHVVLREWNRVLRPGGLMSILIPTDPGIAWRIGRAFGTRPAVLKRGLPYDYFMALEHVNPVNNLVALLEYYFPDGASCWWPFRVASMDLNFFYAFHGRKPAK